MRVRVEFRLSPTVLLLVTVLCWLPLPFGAAA